MKYLVLVSFLLLTSCATSFVPFSKIESIGDTEIKNEDLKVTLGIQPLGDNGRFRDKADEKKITFLKLKLKNISENNISISAKNIYLRGIENEPISQLQPEEVADRMSLATGTYWLWSLLWLGVHNNDNGKVSSIWLPIGLPIGAINYFRAKSTNSDFKNELLQNSFKNVELEKNSETSGMLIFTKSEGIISNLVVEYVNNLGEKKEIVIPYKL